MSLYFLLLPLILARYTAEVLLLPSSSSPGNVAESPLLNMHPAANTSPAVLLPTTLVQPQQILPIESTSNANPGVSGARSGVDPTSISGLDTAHSPTPNFEAGSSSPTTAFPAEATAQTGAIGRGSSTITAHPPTYGPRPACQWLCATAEDPDPALPPRCIYLLCTVHWQMMVPPARQFRACMSTVVR
jgi:hypothetical protein